MIFEKGIFYNGCAYCWEIFEVLENSTYNPAYDERKVIGIIIVCT